MFVDTEEIDIRLTVSVILWAEERGGKTFDGCWRFECGETELSFSKDRLTSVYTLILFVHISKQSNQI